MPRPRRSGGRRRRRTLPVRPTTTEEVGDALAVGGGGRRRGRRPQWWSQHLGSPPGRPARRPGRVHPGRDRRPRRRAGRWRSGLGRCGRGPLAPHGLGPYSGDTGSVGVRGTLGSGVGWLVRSVGLAADQLVGVHFVTADGSVVTAFEDENAEPVLLALRGGGGNFGIATRLDFRATRSGERRVRNRARRQRRPAGHDPRSPGRDACRTPRARGHAAVAAADGSGCRACAAPEPARAGDDEDAVRTGSARPGVARGGPRGSLKTVPYGSTLSEPPEGPPGPPPRRTGSNGVFREPGPATAERAAAALDAHPATISGSGSWRAFGDVPKDATALAWRDAEALVAWIAALPPDARRRPRPPAGRGPPSGTGADAGAATSPASRA